jgi:hypothetical protein
MNPAAPAQKSWLLKGICHPDVAKNPAKQEEKKVKS